MNFQEQKFPILLGTITAVVAGGLLWWGSKGGSQFEESKAAYDTAVSQISSLNRDKIPPTDENRRGKEKAVAEFRGEVEELQKAFDPYRVPKPESMDPAAFTDKMLEATKRVTAKFERAGTELPNGFYLGYNKYTEGLAKSDQTGLLGYGLEASEEMFAKLAEAAPAELLNVYRQPLPEESGATEESEGKAFRTHSFEVTFAGREEALREFLGSLDNSERFYYVVRSMRVSNEKDTAPSAKDARFEQPTAAGGAAAGAFSGGGGFVFPGEESAPAEEAAEEAPAEEAAAEEPADTGEILKQVLGSEKTRVFLRIDVLQFLEAKPLPKG